MQKGSQKFWKGKLLGKVVRVTIHLYRTTKSVKLYIIFLRLDSILAKIFGGFAPELPLRELTALPHTPYLLELIIKFLQITSEKIIRTLCYYNLKYSQLCL